MVFALLGCFSLVAHWWKPRKDLGGKIPLTWVAGTNPMRSTQIGGFNRENPDLHLALDYGNNGLQKILLQCASGVGPDIFEVFGSEELQTYVESGIAWDITEPARKGGFSADNAIWPAAREEITYQGRQYAYSCSLVAEFIIYNKNVFDHLGLPYPEDGMTWSQFVELGRQINIAAAQKPSAGRKIIPCGNLGWEAFFESQRGEFIAEDGRLRIADSAELRTAFEMHRDFIFKHRITPSKTDVAMQSGQGGFGAGVINQFAAGNFAMMKTGEWVLINFNNVHTRQRQELEKRGVSAATLPPLERPLRLGCVMIPRFPDREPGLRIRNRSAAINMRSPRREQALAFLQYMAGPTYSQIINEGVDGLPGNPAFVELGVTDLAPDLARLDMHEMTKVSARYGYSPRKSPYLLQSEIMRILRAQIDRLENNPALPIDGILQQAQAQLEKLMHRNLDHDAELQKQFVARFGEQALKDL